MKNLKIATVLIALFTLSLSPLVSKAENSKINDRSPYILLNETNALFLEMIQSNTSAEFLALSEMEEIVMEETLEMEGWMMKVNWIQEDAAVLKTTEIMETAEIVSETILEEELQLENWMKSPGNWNALSGN